MGAPIPTCNPPNGIHAKWSHTDSGKHSPEIEMETAISEQL